MPHSAIAIGPQKSYIAQDACYLLVHFTFDIFCCLEKHLLGFELGSGSHLKLVSYFVHIGLWDKEFESYGISEATPRETYTL